MFITQKCILFAELNIINQLIITVRNWFAWCSVL